MGERVKDQSMINVSLVLYKTKYSEVEDLIKELCACEFINVIYIVDNSPIKSLIYNSIGSKITYKFIGENLGFGKAHNIAIAESINNKIDYHLIINPDVTLSKTTIEYLHNFMTKNPKCGLVTPKIYYNNGELQRLCKRIPNAIELFGKRFPIKRISEYFSKKIELSTFKYDFQLNVPYLSGCFMFCKTLALKEVGGFDQRYFMYMEDLDLTRSIHERYETLFLPEVSIQHGYRSESKTNLKLLVALIISAIKYFNKWGWIFDKEKKVINTRLFYVLKKHNTPNF